MKFKKAIFTSVAAISLGAVITPAITNAQNTVSAATVIKELTKNAFIYNSKGKRVKKIKLVKGKWVKVLGTKTIKGKKYYRIGKNQYIKVANFKTFKPDSQQPSPNMPSQTIPAPTVPSVPDIPQQQPTTPPSNNNGGISNSNGNNSNTNNTNTDKSTEPTKPTTPPEKDALIAYLKQVYPITYNERCALATRKNRINFLDAIRHAHFVAQDKNSTSDDLNNAKIAVEQAYNNLDGQRYALPCSQADFVHGTYKLTDTDKTAILTLVNKVEGSTDAHFTDATNQYVSYTTDNIYPNGHNTSDFVKFAN